MIFNKTKCNYTEINIDEYLNNKVVLDLNGEKEWLVASERFANFPGWRASINGKNIEMLKANNVITAVYLDGEKGRLVFEYKPNLFIMGKLISSLAFVVIIIYFGIFIYTTKIKSGGAN